jgi:hypothetical protein
MDEALEGMTVVHSQGDLRTMRVVVGIKIIFIGICLLFPSLAMAEDTYIQFTLPSRAYHDQNGRVLESVEGRKNKKGVDEFSGGGRDYPNMNGSVIKEWHEKGKDFLLAVEAPATTLEKQGKKLTKEEAKILKETLFGISEPSSGVTK